MNVFWNPILAIETAAPSASLRGGGVQALHDFGGPGVVLLILACSVLVYAFTRNVRTTLSVTLAGAFMLLASGWVFQVSRQSQPAPRPQARETVQDAVPNHLASSTLSNEENVPAVSESPELLAMSGDFGHLADQPGRLMDGAYVKVASSGRFLSVEQCQPSLEQSIRHEVQSYVGMRLGRQAEAHLAIPQDWIDTHVVRGKPVEETVTSTTVEEGGKRLHALLVFDQKAQEDLKAMLRDARAFDRSLFTILIGVCVAMVAGAFYGALKIDTATKGYYAFRLKAGVFAVVALTWTAILVAVEKNLIW